MSKKYALGRPRFGEYDWHTASFIVAVDHGQQQKGFTRGEEVVAAAVLLIYIEYFVAVGVFLN